MAHNHAGPLICVPSNDQWAVVLALTSVCVTLRILAIFGLIPRFCALSEESLGMRPSIINTLSWQLMFESGSVVD